MNEQGIRFRLGVFVLAAMILLALLIILFGRFPTFLKGASKRYYVVFDYAPGVAVNTPVRRSGVRIGQVEQVQLDDATGKVRVTILIDPPHVLYTDDRPRLAWRPLGGGLQIRECCRLPGEPQPSAGDGGSVDAGSSSPRRCRTSSCGMVRVSPASKRRWDSSRRCLISGCPSRASSSSPTGSSG